MVSEDAHLPLVTDDVYEAAQARFDKTVRSAASARAKRNYLFAGMVRCCAGHQPLAMNGKARKGHHYYACAYATTYGDNAALDAHGGQKWIYVREDWLERLVMRFFEQRIFGPMRLDKLAKQLGTHNREQRRNGKLGGTRIRQQIADLDRKIKAQVVALEKGIEPEFFSERIGELREQKVAAGAPTGPLLPQRPFDPESTGRGCRCVSMRPRRPMRPNWGRSDSLDVSVGTTAVPSGAAKVRAGTGFVSRATLG